MSEYVDYKAAEGQMDDHNICADVIKFWYHLCCWHTKQSIIRYSHIKESVSGAYISSLDQKDVEPYLLVLL